MPVDTLRILIADDHALVREGIRRLLDSHEHFVVIAEAATGLQAVELAQSTRPTVAIMDVSMPGMSGIEATRLVKERCPSVRVIAFTRRRDLNCVRQMLEAGAVGYVLKQSPSEELLAALRAIARGEEYLDKAMVRDRPVDARHPRT